MDQENSAENTQTPEPVEPITEPTIVTASEPITEPLVLVGDSEPAEMPVADSGALPTETPQPAPIIATEKPPTKKPKITVLVAVAIALLFLGSGAAAYMKFVVNSPEKIWEKALQNTSAGYKEIVEISKKEPAKGGNMEGTFALSSPVTANGSVKGNWFNKESQVTGKVDVSGVSANIEARTINSASNPDSADIYLKIDGLASALPIIGAIQPSLAPIVSEINGNWYSLDSALLSSMLPAESSSTTMSLSKDEISDVTSKIGVVLDERLFTVDSAKAVVIVKDSVGQEEFNGHSTYKYNVAVQDQQFKDFVAALKDSLKGTALENLSNELMSKDTSSSKMDVDGLINTVEGSNITSYRAEAWVDAKLKYIRNVRITPVDKDGKTQGYIDIGLDYNGGDVWPFSIGVVTTETDTSKDAMDATFTAAFNKVSMVTDLGFDVSGVIEKQQVKGSGKLTITPSNDAIKVEKPEGAKSVMDLLGAFMGGGNPSLSQTKLDSMDMNMYPIDDIELQ